MAVPLLHLVVMLCLASSSTASVRSLHQSPADAAESSPSDASRPTTYFEVDRPLRPPPGSSGPCSTLLLSHSFGFTFTKPPATAAYSPPRCLAVAGGTAASISLAVLEWRAACRGVQYDRIFGVWLGGVELLRSSTAEPRPNGVVWSVSKDVTRYASLLAAAGNSTLAVYLGNLVNSQLTGVYHANLTLHLYFRRHPPPATMHPADLVVPMSRSLPLNDAPWYVVQNATDVASVSVTLPSNAYRVVLEVYASPHEDDEFWYMNKSPFRAVTVRVDKVLTGAAAWPFPVIYTGGINPLLWQPVTAIGSFNLPSYSTELTPLLGELLDGKPHEFVFAVTNAQDMWYVDANLHLWLDPESAETTGSLVSHDAPELEANTTTSRSSGGGHIIEYHTTARWHVSAVGWMNSSYGNVTTNSTQTFGFENLITVNDDGSSETVNQTTVERTSVYFMDEDHDAGVLYSFHEHRNFPLYLDLQAEQVTVAHGLEEETVAAGRWSGGRLGHGSLRTVQTGVVDLENRDGSSVAVSWRSRQTYSYDGSDGCYLRNVTSRGDGIVSDQSNEACAKDHHTR